MCKVDKADVCAVASDESSYVTVCLFIPLNDALLTLMCRAPISQSTAVYRHAMLRRWANKSFLLPRASSKRSKNKRMHLCNVQYSLQNQIV